MQCIEQHVEPTTNAQRKPNTLQKCSNRNLDIHATSTVQNNPQILQKANPSQKFKQVAHIARPVVHLAMRNRQNRILQCNVRVCCISAIALSEHLQLALLTRLQCHKVQGVQPHRALSTKFYSHHCVHAGHTIESFGLVTVFEFWAR